MSYYTPPGSYPPPAAAAAYAASYASPASYAPAAGYASGQYPAYSAAAPASSYGAWGAPPPPARQFTPKAKITAPPVAYHCEICDLNCVGQDAYNSHMSGRKHAIQAKKKAAADAAATQTPDSSTSSPAASSDVRYSPYGAPANLSSATKKFATGRFYCDQCHVYSTDQNTYDLHLAGKKHRAMVQNANKPLSAPNASPADSATQASTQDGAQQPPDSSSAASSGSGDAASPSSTSRGRGGPVRRGGYGYQRGYGGYHGGGGGNHGYGNGPAGYGGPKQPPSGPRFPLNTVSMSPTNSNDDALLFTKHADLSPTAASAMSLATLVRTVSNKLNEVGKKQEDASSEPSTPVQVVVNETKLVGPYAKGIMLKENLCADIVAITRAPPNPAALEFLQNAIAAAVPDGKVTVHTETSEIVVQENDYKTHVMVTWLGAWTAKKESEASSSVQAAATAADSSVASATPTPDVTTTTTGDAVMADQPTADGGAADAVVAADQPSTADGGSVAVPTPTPDGNTGFPPAAVGVTAAAAAVETLEGVNIEACQSALLAIRHMIWFNDHANSANIRSVMRLINDFRARVPIFQRLSPWSVELIVANALRTNPPNCSLSQSVRSVFAYLASGVLLPGIEIVDPCQHHRVNILALLSGEERLGITALAQEVVRDIAYGKWEKVIG